MAYFHTQKMPFFWKALGVKSLVYFIANGPFHCRFWCTCFIANWYFNCHFGILCGFLVFQMTVENDTLADDISEIGNEIRPKLLP
jgi:hypothetical protein